MEIVRTRAELRRALTGASAVHLVPTMGNLHAGHLSLVQLARRRPGAVVASIFVNPLQFSPHEDFASYPRTLDRDCELLSNAGCDIVFAPTDAEMYPEPQECKVIPPPRLGDVLEGHFRPGFFTGVCTVVLKLFNLVQPSTSVFGKKDYQQLLVIQNMVRQLTLPIEVIPGGTVRGSSGLALSSRNGYLTAAELEQASQLQQALRQVAAKVELGKEDWAAIELEAMKWLAARDWQPDYVAIRTRDGLNTPVTGAPLVVLGAAKLGTTRLIDNLEI